MRVFVLSLLAWCWVVAGVEGANILMTNYSADGTEVRPLRLEGGEMLGEGGAVVAVGSFIGMSDTEIRGLARSAEGIGELGRRFVVHGDAVETGTGGVLEETGIYGTDAPAQILPGDELAGEPIYTVVSTAGGLLVWKSGVVFPVDAPISVAGVTMTDVPVDVLGSQLLVGGTGGVVEVEYFGGPMVTVELAAVDGLFEIPGERVVRFEKEAGGDAAETTVAVEDEPEVGVEVEVGVEDPPRVPEDEGIVLVDLADGVGGVVLPPNWFEQGGPRWYLSGGVVAEGWEGRAVALRGLEVFQYAAGDGVMARIPLPEPDVAGLLGPGGALLLLRRRRG